MATLEDNHIILSKKVEHFRDAAFMAEGIPPPLQAKLEQRMEQVITDIRTQSIKTINAIDQRFTECARVSNMLMAKLDTQKAAADASIASYKNEARRIATARSTMDQSIDDKLAAIAAAVSTCTLLKDECHSAALTTDHLIKELGEITTAVSTCTTLKDDCHSVWTKADRLLNSKLEVIDAAVSSCTTLRDKCQALITKATAAHCSTAASDADRALLVATTAKVANIEQETQKLSTFTAARTEELAATIASHSSAIRTASNERHSLATSTTARTEELAATIASHSSAIRTASNERHSLATHVARQGRATSADLASNMHTARLAAAALREPRRDVWHPQPSPRAASAAPSRGPRLTSSNVAQQHREPHNPCVPAGGPAPSPTPVNTIPITPSTSVIGDTDTAYQTDSDF